MLLRQPLVDRLEAALLNEVAKTCLGVFVGAFSPNRFPGNEGHVKLEGGDVDGLIEKAKQMHLDPTRSGIPEGAVIKRQEVEIRVQLTIDTQENILVERGCYPERIIIGCEQLLL